jgi:hypothetical protein
VLACSHAAKSKQSPTKNVAGNIFIAISINFQTKFIIFLVPELEEDRPKKILRRSRILIRGDYPWRDPLNAHTVVEPAQYGKDIGLYRKEKYVCESARIVDANSRRAKW